MTSPPGGTDGGAEADSGSGPRGGGPGAWRRVLGRLAPRLAAAVDEEALDEIEERLIAADFGVGASSRLRREVERAARAGGSRGGVELGRVLANALGEVFAGDGPRELAAAPNPPATCLVVGVNGVGKTTTVAKLAHRLASRGQSVLVAAADTHRAAAAEQLTRLVEPVGVGMVRGRPGGDPAAVAYDALDAARARGADFLLVDTAGRLHASGGLMEQLAKIRRVLGARHEGSPHETLLVIDGTVGQNGVAQAREFSKFADVTGVVVTKMDSTARGGVVVALRQELGIAPRFVGVGEGIADLELFDPAAFAEAVAAGPRAADP